MFALALNVGKVTMCQELCTGNFHRRFISVPENTNVTYITILKPYKWGNDFCTEIKSQFRGSK